MISAIAEESTLLSLPQQLWTLYVITLTSICALIQFDRFTQMKKKKLILLVLIAALGVLLWLSNAHEYSTLKNLKDHRELLQKYVDEHYFLSVTVFIVFLVSTAFFVPAAAPLTVAGGFLFGVVLGTVYVNIGSVIGSTLAFLSSRFLIGDWIQNRYRNRLKHLNEGVEKHGYNYLFTLRVLPVLPFFLVNYLAGLTKIPLKKFMFITALGMLPGSFVYAFAGRELARIEKLEDILSPELLIAFLLLGLLALSPVVKDLIDGRKRKV
jgi:uncharacterized membrane protein YdjX (TVP38/TMEM64 family)